MQNSSSKIDIDNKTRFRYEVWYWRLLIDALICRASAEAGTQFAIFEMVKVKIIFHVEKTIEPVFDLISDISGYKKWSAINSKFFIENKITSEGPTGLGTTYIDRLRWFGKAVGEIAVYQRPFKIMFQQKVSFGLPAFGAELKYTLKAIQNSTEVIHNVEAIPYGFFNLVRPILSHILHSERNRTCRAIKEALEQK